MKFSILFKTPDALHYAIADALEYETDEDKRIELRGRIREVTDKFLSFGESINIEFDSELGTANVLEKK